MKKISLLLLALIALCGLAHAQVTITPIDTSGEESGISFTTAMNDGRNLPAFNTTYKDLRVYAQGSITISSTVGNIKSIVFYLSAQGRRRLAPITADNGTIAAQAMGDSTVVWTGDAASVTLTVGENADYGSDGNLRAGQFCFTDFVVTMSAIDPDNVAIPVINPVSGTFYASKEVTITAGENATIYYTTNGSTPTVNSTVYTAPFLVSETTTVKAIAVSGSNSSDVAESVITIVTPTIADLLAAGHTEAAQISATVVALDEHGFLLGDETGYIYCYQGSTPDVAIGDVVDVSGAITKYGGCFQFSTPTVSVIDKTDVNYPESIQIDATSLDALVKNPKVTYIQVSGTMISIGDFYNFSVEGATAVGTIMAPPSLLEGLVQGDIVTVTGFYVYNTSNGQYAHIVATEVMKTGHEDGEEELDPTSESEHTSENIGAWTGNVPVAGESYYLYNVGQGQWFCGANNWGTHASLTPVGGLDVTLIASGTGFSLDTQLSNGGNSHFLNDVWCDGAAQTWTFTLGSHGYYINNGTGNLAYGGDGTNLTVSKAITDDNAQWLLVTRADRLAALSHATPSNPVDATFLIIDADFGRNDLRKSAWTTNASNLTLSGGNDVNNCAESWRSTFSISQRIEDIPNGIYGMTAQGFYRIESEQVSKPVFFANDSIAVFPVRTGSENSMSTASESFTAGKYTIDPILFEVFDGAITLGARLDQGTGLWCIWDNFRLTYYGFAEDLGPYISFLATAVEKAEACRGTVPLAVYAQIKAVVDDQNRTYSTSEEYSLATRAIETAIKEYATNDIKEAYSIYQSIRTNVLGLATQQIYTGTATVDVSKADDDVEAAMSVAAIHDATRLLKLAAGEFLSAVTIHEDAYFDVTGIFITNPAPTSNSNGWTVLDADSEQANVHAFDTLNNCAEFWGQRGYSISQQLTDLPQGTYVLESVAFTRAADPTAQTAPRDFGMQGVLRAGATSMHIATVKQSEVNSRTSANIWFNDGNGVNLLPFTVVNEQELSISLTADMDSSHRDWWLVWRHFKLRFLGSDLWLSYKLRLKETVTTAAEELGKIGDECPDAVLADLQEAIADGQKSYGNAEEYEAIIARIQEVTDYARTMHEVYQHCMNVYEANNDARHTEGLAEKETEGNAMSTFDERMSAIREQIRSMKAADEEDGIIESLRTALKTLLVGVAPASGHPIDITMLLNNPDFEEGGEEMMGILPGWECTFIKGETATNIGYMSQAQNGNGVTTAVDNAYVNGDIRVCHFIEAWQQQGYSNSYIGDGELYQRLAGLPVGKYRLVTDAISTYQWDESRNPVSGVFIYIKSGALETRTEIHTANGVPEHFEVDFLCDYAEDLDFGLKTKNCSANWIAADNFHIYFVEALYESPGVTMLKEALPQYEAADIGPCNATVLSSFQTELQKARNWAETDLYSAAHSTECIAEVDILANAYNAVLSSVDKYASLINALTALNEAITLASGETSHVAASTVEQAQQMHSANRELYDNRTITDNEIPTTVELINDMITELTQAIIAYEQLQKALSALHEALATDAKMSSSVRSTAQQLYDTAYKAYVEGTFSIEQAGNTKTALYAQVQAIEQSVDDYAGFQNMVNALRRRYASVALLSGTPILTETADFADEMQQTINNGTATSEAMAGVEARALGIYTYWQENLIPEVASIANDIEQELSVALSYTIKDGFMTSVDLSSKGLSGEFPLSKLLALQHLNTINLSGNSITAVDTDVFNRVDVNLKAQSYTIPLALDLPTVDYEAFYTQIPQVFKIGNGGRFQLSSYSDEWCFTLDADGESNTSLTPSYGVYRGKSGDIITFKNEYGVASGSTIPVSLTFEQGDTNFDGIIDVVDLQNSIYYIFFKDEDESAILNFTAADLFADGKINAQDVVKEVDVLLAQVVTTEGHPQVRRRMPSVQSDEAVATLVMEENRLQLQTAVSVGALDIVISSVAGIDESALKSLGFNVVTSATADGLRIIAYSMSGAEIPVGLTTIATTAEPGAVVRAATLSDSRAKHIAVALNRPLATEIYNPKGAKADADADAVYDLGGRRVPASVALPRGIYIINGKKVVK